MRLGWHDLIDGIGTILINLFVIGWFILFFLVVIVGIWR